MCLAPQPTCIREEQAAASNRGEDLDARAAAPLFPAINRNNSRPVRSAMGFIMARDSLFMDPPRGSHHHLEHYCERLRGPG